MISKSKGEPRVSALKLAGIVSLMLGIFVACAPASAVAVPTPLPPATVTAEEAVLVMASSLETPTATLEPKVESTPTPLIDTATPVRPVDTPTPTPQVEAPTPTAVPAPPTATPPTATATAVPHPADTGAVTLTTDLALYEEGDPITVTITNGLAATIYAQTGETYCSVLTAQLLNNGAWSSEGACSSGESPAVVPIAAKSEIQVEIVAAMLSDVDLQPGQYRIEFSFRRSPSAQREAVYSALFVIVI